MSNASQGQALVVIEPQTGTVLAGLTRRTGGPVPALAELTGDEFDVVVVGVVQHNDGETTKPALAPVPVPGVSPSKLEVVEVKATEADIRACAGMRLVGDGASRVLQGTVDCFSLVTKWDAPSHTLTVGLSATVGAVTVLSKDGGRSQVDLTGVTAGSSKDFKLQNARAPLILVAPGVQPFGIPVKKGEEEL